jgi:hypothetical protein
VSVTQLSRALSVDKDYLTLKGASASRPSGEWGEDDYDVLADSVVVGCIFKAEASPVGKPWMWTVLSGYHEDRTPTRGYEPTREAAMARAAIGEAAGPLNGALRARARIANALSGLHRRTATERFATILLPNSVAQGGTGRHKTKLNPEEMPTKGPN